MTDPGTPLREHLFLSYATEDWPLAEWLTRRLTAEGYRVWCDRFKLLGGESYPKDIDKAISDGCFRLIALLSRFSKAKDNPVKERTKALNVGRVLGISDFLIPLNVDGMQAAELDWMTSDLTFISFHRGWAGGLRQLLDKLKRIEAPRTLPNGQRVAIESYLPRETVSPVPEYLFTNCLPFSRVPSTLLRFTVDPPLMPEERRPAAIEWPHHHLSPRELVSFQPPPPSLLQGRVTLSARLAWAEMLDIGGIRTGDLLSTLLNKGVMHRAKVRGLQRSFDHRLFYYFPVGLCKDDKVVFQIPDGGSTWVRVIGERTYWRLGVSQRYRYHLGAAFRVRRDLVSGYVLQITPVFHITDLAGQPLPARTVGSRRKRLAIGWWNYEWLSRHRAFVSFLAGDEDPVRLGGEDSDPIELSVRMIRLDAPVGINEAALEVESNGEGSASDSDDDGDDEEGEDENV